MPLIAAPPPNFPSSSRPEHQRPNEFRHIQSTDQLHCELAACRSDERAAAVLRGYIAPRAEGKKACEKVLNDVEAKHSKSVHAVRLTYGLKPRRPTTSPTAQIRARNAAPIRSATGTVFGPDVLSPNTRTELRQPRQSSAPAPAGAAGGGLPPYSERDPDPASTMLLERRLASELNELGGLSGFCVESTDPDYLDGLRDENESRRFSAGEPGAETRRSAMEERNRNENAARRVSMPVLPVRRDERRGSEREREQREQREVRSREQGRREREPGRQAGRSARRDVREVRDSREAQLRDRREDREAQLRRPSGAHRRSGEQRDTSGRASGPTTGAMEFIQPRQRRSSASPTAPTRPAELPDSSTSPTSPVAVARAAPPPTALRSPPPLPPRNAPIPPRTNRTSSWLPHPPPLPRIDTESLLGPSPIGSGSGSASPRSSASESPVTPVTPVLARAPSPPAYTTLDPRQVTRSPPTTSLNVRPRRSLRSPSSPNAAPCLPPVHRLREQRDQRTMGDLMSDIVPVAGLAGPGVGLGLASPSVGGAGTAGMGLGHGTGDVCVPAAISPLGEDMVIPASDRYGERYAALAGTAHAAATGNGGRIKNLMKRWSGGHRRMAAA